MFHGGEPMRLLSQAVELFEMEIDPAVGFEREIEWLKATRSLMVK